MSSRSRAFRRMERVEDALALLVDIDDRRKVIRAQAWNRGSWEQVFVEASGMVGEIERLKRELVVVWKECKEASRG